MLKNAVDTGDLVQSKNTYKLSPEFKKKVVKKAKDAAKKEKDAAKKKEKNAAGI